jgi:hypothetical protein
VQVQTTEVSIGKDNQYPKQRVSGAITRLLTSMAARIHVYNSQAKRENDGAIPGYTGIIVAKKNSLRARPNVFNTEVEGLSVRTAGQQHLDSF